MKSRSDRQPREGFAPSPPSATTPAATGGWESQRMISRRANRELVLPPGQLDGAAPQRAPALVVDVREGRERIALSFAGQGSAWLMDLADACLSPSAELFVRRACEHLDGAIAALPATDRAPFDDGYAPLDWAKAGVDGAATGVLDAHLARAAVSAPSILLTQLARLEALRGTALAPALDDVVALCGHSQGALAAACASALHPLQDPLRRADAARPWLVFALHLGLRMEQGRHAGASAAAIDTATDAGHGAPTPMAAVIGLHRRELDDAVAQSDGLVVRAASNGPAHHTLAGTPDGLERLRLALETQANQRTELKKRGRAAGRVASPTWAYLPTSGPFHSQWMDVALARLLDDVSSLGLELQRGRLTTPVVDPHTSLPLVDDGVVLRTLAHRILKDATEWPRAVAHAQHLGATRFIDVGPGDDGARLLSIALAGQGVPVSAAGLASGREALLDEDNAPGARERAWSSYKPTTLRTPDGDTRVANRFTRATGRAPILLPGMTPTTVEAPIVVAAANAGYVSELAGGGQPSEKILRARLDEIVETLEPGRGIVFNALYLDPYLWGLHFAKQRLVIRLKDEGYPIEGVTISAGIPPADDAHAILAELREHGMWLNALKPGSSSQIEEALRIADDEPADLYLHVEGGRAGGHHSWESLDDLLLRNYGAIRKRDNVILCVGGGIARPEQATSYLDGSWARVHGYPDMPVDAVFLGTRLMAVKEAHTSTQVKAALVRGRGEEMRWPLDGVVEGDVTSGKSSLDASIYYLNNTAAQVGRLLDEVAGDAEKVEARRPEIVDALAKTAKPYFGDVAAMTCEAFLRALVDRLAIGRGTAYEDGAFLDVTWRARFETMVRAIESRLADAPTSSVLQSPGHDEPEASPWDVVNALCERYPDARTVRMHPEDARRFLQVCRMPGKPVPFVPVIDADVRRWFKADSLWQAHDERLAADGVLTIPGPSGLSTIERSDEPVADVLDGFHVDMVARLKAVRASVVDTWADVRQSGSPAPLAAGARAGRLSPTPADVASPEGWLERVASLGSGPLAAAVRERNAFAQGRVTSNPLRLVLVAIDGQRLDWTLDDTGRLTSLTLADPRERPLVRVSFDSELRATLVLHDDRGERELDLCLSWRDEGPSGVLCVDRTRWLAEQRALFAERVVGPRPAKSPGADGAFATVEEDIVVDDERLRAFGALTSAGAPGVGVGIAFSLAWPATWRALSQAPGDLFRLVHEEHRVETLAWPVTAGERLVARARVTSVEDLVAGRRVETRAELVRGDGNLVARVHDRFFIREVFDLSPGRLDLRVQETTALHVDDEGAARFVGQLDWLELTREVRPGERLVLDVVRTTTRADAAAVARHTATGTALVDGEVVGEIRLDSTADGDHPVLVAADLLSGGQSAPNASTARVGSAVATAPRELLPYAAASGDRNPLHLDSVVARLAGFSSPIVHGMWTASWALQRTSWLAADGDPSRVRLATLRFAAPVLPGAALSLEIERTGSHNGGQRLAVTVRADGVIALEADVDVSPPRTAYVFPGQGTQAPDMGMDGYARSAAARAAWDEADDVCRARFGFSLLEVVRENPRELWLFDERVHHPDGVLFLTQFTQVALAVLAVAQARELEEAGLLDPTAHYAGHSLGEYSALAALGGVLPLAAVVEIVYQRGLTMDRIVERDEGGRSPWAMGVLLPHRAGLNEAAALSLVDTVRERSGLPLEVVNFNSRGRQYSVTGHKDALEVLAGELGAGWAKVPGVDVPFHSTVLRGGVDAFRQTLQATLPERVSAARLCDRYIPNLTGTAFALSEAFFDDVDAACGAPVSAPWRARLAAAASSDELARDMLIELLAWQFASPVQWIRTQDLLFDVFQGVDSLLEVGPGHAPTLANMARGALRAAGRTHPRVLHVEADRAALAGPSRAAPAPVAAPASPVAEPARAALVAEPVAPAAAGGPAVAVDDDADTLASGVLTLVSILAKQPIDDIDTGRSIDALLGGNSARRNQVLADLAAELGVRAMDGAHEVPLDALLTTLAGKVRGYTGWGPFLTSSCDQALSTTLAPSGLDRLLADEYLGEQWGLPASHRTCILHRASLRARADKEVFTEGAAARGWLDAQARAWAASAGFALAAPQAAGTGGAVDAGALADIEASLNGQLENVGRAVAQAVGLPLLEGDAIAAPVVSPRRHDEEIEHGEGYLDAITPRFDALKHVGFTSAWAWSRRDLLDFHARLASGDVAGVDASDLGDRLDESGRAMARALAARESAPAIAAQLLALAESSPAVPEHADTVALVTGAGPGSIALDVVKRLLRQGARVVATTSSYGVERVALFKRAYQDNAVPGAQLHVVPFNQGSFEDVDALVSWLAKPVTERVGSTDKLVRQPLTPTLVLPFAAVGESADLTTMGPRSVATLRVLLLGVERLIAKLSALPRKVGSKTHVVLPLSPNHGAFGGDGAYGESKAALEVLLNKHRAEREAWGAATTLVGARIGWVRGTGLMKHNDRVAEDLTKIGVRTFSQAEMADELMALCGQSSRDAAIDRPIEADLTGGLGEVADLGDRLRRAHEALALEDGAGRRHDQLLETYDVRTGAAEADETRQARQVRPAARPQVLAPIPSEDELATLPACDHLNPEHVVAVIGYGEVGPYGSARTRWQLERDGVLSLEAIAELAWTMGLVAPAEDGVGLVDVETGEAVEDADLHERYEERVLAHVGVRVVEPDERGYDPAALVQLVDVHLDQDFSFPVPSREAAESLRAAAPSHTQVHERDGRIIVTRQRGAVLRVPSALKWQRHVAGQLPTGWSAERFGVPADMAEQVDPVTLYCLIATAEAFLMAGLEPEEVYGYLHPSRVGITLGTGIGGMEKLRRLHRDLYDRADRQNDTLQETLINVIGGWVVQSFLGSYGPMSFPVGACATAGVSVADGVEKILGGVADVIVAGGADDLSEAGLVGFGDMGATADTRDMESRGIDPTRMSRPSDSRRRGFVEAQGAGVLLLARASLALRHGLPVYGIVGWAGSSGDGVQRSVPAPGQGALIAATGKPTTDAAGFVERRARLAKLIASRDALVEVLGEREADETIARGRHALGHDPAASEPGLAPLSAALAVFGLGADDIAVVSKHDSSTQANDENEARLHTRLADALGRKQDLPLPVISQKALTGHPKGAAAAWQMNGLLQAMADGVLPKNASLDDVSAELAEFGRLVASDRPRDVPRASLRAGLVTTLGFGHVSAMVCLVHPFLFWRMLSDDQRVDYRTRVERRLGQATSKLQSVLSGRAPLFVRRDERPFDDAAHEASVLLNPNARLRNGRFEGPTA